MLVMMQVELCRYSTADSVNGGTVRPQKFFALPYTPRAPLCYGRGEFDPYGSSFYFPARISGSPTRSFEVSRPQRCASQRHGHLPILDDGGVQMAKPFLPHAALSANHPPIIRGFERIQKLLPDAGTAPLASGGLFHCEEKGDAR
jgi:hypothetical protein